MKFWIHTSMQENTTQISLAFEFYTLTRSQTKTTQKKASYGKYYYTPLDFLIYFLGLPLLGHVCRFGQT